MSFRSLTHHTLFSIFHSHPCVDEQRHSCKKAEAEQSADDENTVSTTRPWSHIRLPLDSVMHSRYSPLARLTYWAPGKDAALCRPGGWVARDCEVGRPAL